MEIESQVPKLVKEFSPQRDKAQLAKCEMVKASIKFAIDVAMEAMGIGTTFLAGPFLGKVSRGGGKAFMKIGDYINKSPIPGLREKQLASWIKSSAAVTKFSTTYGQITQKVVEEHKKTMKNSGDKTKSSDTSPMPSLEMHLSTARGMCGNIFGVAEDDSSSTIDSVTKFIVDYLVASQDALENHFNSLMSYHDPSDYETDDSVLGVHLLDRLMDAEYLRVGSLVLHKDTKRYLRLNRDS